MKLTKRNVRCPPKKCCNCVETLRPILILCSIFGACNVTIKDDTLKFSWWKTVFCTGTIILCFSHMVITPAVLKHRERVSDRLDDLTSPYFITKVANPMAISITSLFYRLYAIFLLHKKLGRIVGDLQKIDGILHLNPKHHKQDKKRSFCYVAFMVALFPLQIYSVYDVADGFNPYTLFHIIVLTNNYALQCTEFLFTSLCYLIQTRFAHISKKLQRKIQPKDTPNTVCKTVDTFTFKQTTPCDDPIAADEIQILRVAFQKLAGISETLNDHYNLHLLVSLGVCTFNVLTNLYMGLFGNVAAKFTVEALLWACYYFSRFFWICVACEFLGKEAFAVKGNLSGALNRNWGRLAKEEIWIFLGVLQTTEVKFTACGFFTIDFTLITAAVATGATYLVVLAQFHKG